MKFIFFSLLFLFISCEVENDNKENVSMSKIAFQYAVLYSLSEDGVIQLLKVEDESF